MRQRRVARIESGKGEDGRGDKSGGEIDDDSQSTNTVSFRQGGRGTNTSTQPMHTDAYRCIFEYTDTDYQLLIG